MTTKGRASRRSSVDGRRVSEFDLYNVPGNDEFDGEEVVVTFDGDSGVAALRPRSFDRLDAEQQDLATHAMAIVGRRRQLAGELEKLVPVMREAGLSWAQIGWCVGTSGEAARQRWGLDS